MKMTEEKPKQKFTFNCTKCGKCCAERGPVPLVMDDLTLWARNNVVANIMPHLKFIKTPFGTIDLVMGRQDKDPMAFMKPKKEEEAEKEPIDLSCPMYNPTEKTCLVYENRPMSCRTYPLEYDGEKYMVVDAENCEGIGNGETTKEERKAMRDLAKEMNVKLTEMRVAMPVLAQAMQPFVISQLMEAQQEYMKQMEKMSPEDKAKYEEQMKSQMEGK